MTSKYDLYEIEYGYTIHFAYDPNDRDSDRFFLPASSLEEAVSKGEVFLKTEKDRISKIWNTVPGFSHISMSFQKESVKRIEVPGFNIILEPK